MKVRIDYPVSAEGKAKGYRTTKKVMGALSVDVDIEETSDALVKFITLQRPPVNNGNPLKSSTYLIDESGQVLKPYDNGIHQGDAGPVIAAILGRYNQAPLAKDALERALKSHRNLSEADLKNYYKGEIRRIIHEPLPLLTSENFQEVELKTKWTNEDAIRDEARELVIQNGTLFKKVPEPFWIVTYNSEQPIGVQIKLLEADGYYELARLFNELPRNQYQLIGTFGLNDTDRALAYAREIAGRLNARCGEPVGPDVILEDPYRVVGTGYNLYAAAFEMRRAAVQSITNGAPYTTDGYASKICKWNGETLSLFKRLNDVISPEKWASNMEELEDVVKDIMRLEGHKSPEDCIFRNCENKGDLIFSDEMWQEWLMMEPVRLPSLSSL